MKIIFHTPQIDVRGSCVSLYDYAHYNETLLGNRSIILTSRISNHDAMAVYKFSKRFKIVYYTDPSEIDPIIEKYACDVLYTIKYGKKDNIVSTKAKTVVHCVFDLSEPHGDVYAAVSETLATKFGKTDFVPHMIGLTPSCTGDNMREQLGIPSDATVFGRHGGQDTFDLEIAKVAIVHAVHDFPHLHFVFVNTPCFHDHPRIHHLGKIVDLGEKTRFIMTCDAMIHAQSLGETFGISIGEFSVNNKPVIAYNGKVWNDHYKNILGDKAIWYLTENECYNIFQTFDPKDYLDKDLNCYKKYSPANVMQKFKEVFLD